jgi:hypothetical protein
MVEDRASSINDERSSSLLTSSTTSSTSSTILPTSINIGSGTTSTSLHHRIGAGEDDDDMDMDVDVGGINDLWSRGIGNVTSSSSQQSSTLPSTTPLNNNNNINISSRSGGGIPLETGNIITSSTAAASSSASQNNSNGSNSISNNTLPISSLPSTNPTTTAGGGDFCWIDFADRDLASLAVYNVLDKEAQGENRSISSLPINVTIRASPDDGKHGIWSVDYIPRGVRFGPLFGEGKTPNLHEATVMPAEATAAGGSSYGNGAWSLEELKEISSGSSSNNNSKKLSTPLQWKILSESGGRVIKIIDTTNCKKSNWL